MNQTAVYALGMSLAAGLCTALGGMLGVAVQKPSKRFLAAMLGFSGGIMMTVSLADLLPEAMKTLTESCGRAGGSAAFFAAAAGGMLAACLVDSFLPGVDAERDENGAMHRVGIFSMLALLLHNLPEGVAVFVGGCADLRIGLSLSIAIAMHNIPEGISVALPIAASTGKRWKGVLAATFSGLSEPAGAVLAYLFLAPLFGEVLLATIFALAAGLMLYVVFDELIPASFSMRRPGWSLLGVLTGILVMLFSIAIV